jgi:hypothetical protein
MKRRFKIIRIVGVFLLLIATHFSAYVVGVYMFYKKDFCKLESGMIPVELATNTQFMSACETMKNSTNEVEVYDAATLFVPVLSKHLKNHPDGIHIDAISTLLGWKAPYEGPYMFYFLKKEGCLIHSINFLSLRPYHVTSVSMGVGEM